MFKSWRNKQLHQAAKRGDVLAIRRLLEKGADPKAQREHGSRSVLAPLHVAILNGSKASMDILLAAGAEPDSICTHRLKYSSDFDVGYHDNIWSSLHLAVEVASPEMIFELCDRGVDANYTVTLGKTPLHYSSHMARVNFFHPNCENHLTAMRSLLSSGADANARDDKGRSPLFYASRTNGNAAAIRLLLDAGTDINAVDCSGQSALFWADGTDVVELFLEHGADPRIQSEKGWTALACARFAGIHVSKVRLLEAFEA